jgi:hypothetical protein
VPNEYNLEVKENLSFLNSPKLNQRLTELIDDLVEIGILAEDLFETQDMAKKARYCRNYYTHYNAKDKSKALFGKDLELLTRDCRTLINVLILKKLGVPKAVILKNFENYIDTTFYLAF